MGSADKNFEESQQPPKLFNANWLHVVFGSNFFRKQPFQRQASWKLHRYMVRSCVQITLGLTFYAELANHRLASMSYILSDLLHNHD